MDYTEEELRKAALYPFMRKAREYVSSLSLTLEEIVKHPVYSASMEWGAMRAMDCVEGKFIPKVGDRLECELTILSYPVARMLVGSMGSRAISEKYASGEVKAVKNFLVKEKQEFLTELSGELNLSYSDDSIPLVTYLHLTAGISKTAPKWKLINRIVESGRVKVDRDEQKTLLEEAVRQKIAEPAPAKKIPDEIKKRAKSLKGLLTPERQDLKIEKVDEKALPPCVNGMLVALEGGGASHNAMFVLATFFTNMSLGVEDTVNIFRKSPKFKEETTRYQLEFLSGQKSNTEYTCPTCATIKSWGLCKWDCPVKHPIQYYRGHSRVSYRNYGKGTEGPSK